MGLSRRLITLGVLGLAMSACGSAPTLTGRVVRAGVAVDARLEGDSLTVTFTPSRAGFHVYSVDLPASGIDGLGVATQVQVGGGMRATDGPVVSRRVRHLDYPTLGLTLPVYPDGPVALRYRVDRSEENPRLLVTYAACSESRCLVPVRDLAVPLGR
jgi:hypothetical protein